MLQQLHGEIVEHVATITQWNSGACCNNYTVNSGACCNNSQTKTGLLLTFNQNSSDKQNYTRKHCTASKESHSLFTVF